MMVRMLVLLALSFVPPWIEAQESPGIIERRYNQLVEADNASFERPDTERFKSLEDVYIRLFEDKTIDWRHVTDSDLTFLFRAAQRIHFYTHEPKYGSEMAKYLAAMEARHIASENNRVDYYRSLIAERKFAEADRYTHLYSIPEKDHAPIMRDPGMVLQDLPAVLELDLDGKSLGVHQVNVDTLHVVVVATPWCHFARNGIRAIESHSDVAQALKGRALWLMPVEGNLDVAAVKKWNMEHPRQSMVYAYKKEHWSMLSEWGTPTFYFFKDGQVVAQLAGWRSDEEGVATLRENLKKIGLIK